MPFNKSGLTLLIFLILLSGCSVVKKNGYTQSRKYKTKSQIHGLKFLSKAESKRKSRNSFALKPVVLTNAEHKVVPEAIKTDLDTFHRRKTFKVTSILDKQSHARLGDTLKHQVQGELVLTSAENVVTEPNLLISPFKYNPTDESVEDNPEISKNGWKFIRVLSFISLVASWIFIAVTFGWLDLWMVIVLGFVASLSLFFLILSHAKILPLERRWKFLRNVSIVLFVLGLLNLIRVPLIGLVVVILAVFLFLTALGNLRTTQ